MGAPAQLYTRLRSPGRSAGKKPALRPGLIRRTDGAQNGLLGPRLSWPHAERAGLPFAAEGAVLTAPVPVSRAPVPQVPVASRALRPPICQARN